MRKTKCCFNITISTTRLLALCLAIAILSSGCGQLVKTELEPVVAVTAVKRTKFNIGPGICYVQAPNFVNELYAVYPGVWVGYAGSKYPVCSQVENRALLLFNVSQLPKGKIVAAGLEYGSDFTILRDKTATNIGACIGNFYIANHSLTEQPWQKDGELIPVLYDSRNGIPMLKVVKQWVDNGRTNFGIYIDSNKYVPTPPDYFQDYTCQAKISNIKLKVVYYKDP